MRSLAYDGLMTYRVVQELQSLVGGRINKVHQPYSLDLMLQIRSNRQNAQLLISANAMYARLQLTDTPIKNPQPINFGSGSISLSQNSLQNSPINIR